MTKIICTIGPASAGTGQLTALIEAGMDIARLNFSHGTHEQHALAIRDIREAAAATGKDIAILQDLQGPKIRTGHVPEGGVELADGAAFTITMDELPLGSAARVGCTYKGLAADVQPGNTMLLDDGYIILTVQRVSGNDVETIVVKGGVLRNSKGIVVPGASISAPAISEKDIEDLRFGLAAGVDAVALSFVSSERDIIELRSSMRVFGRTVPIVAKLERAEGIADIEDIIRETDAVMVARGDLGLELPPEDVPVLQKHIIARCNYYGTPVITATQMLESMIDNPRPTRAEASDVANAVIDGTDCVMLSGETSVGHYPLEAVRTMDRVIRKAEEHFHTGGKQYRDSGAGHDIPGNAQHKVTDAIGRACCVVAHQVGAAAIVPLTSSGGTARLIAKYRPHTPILALTDSPETLRRLSFVWGVRALLIPTLGACTDLFGCLRESVVASGIAREGDLVVYTAGMPFAARCSTNMLKVERV